MSRYSLGQVRLWQVEVVARV